MAQQLGLDLPGITALGRTDFLVAPSNTVAVAMIENWHNWSGRKLLLTGPEGSGKTHLTHVWANSSGATIVAAPQLSEKSVPQLCRGSVAVEDIDQISGNAEAERALFHLHNLLLAEGHWLLLTGRGAPKQWGMQLPDLASRLGGAQTATLDAPDDALLSAVLAKLFADRQLTPKADIIPFLIRRIDRSFAAAQDVVTKLDAASLAQKRPLTRQLARAVLDNSQDTAP